MRTFPMAATLILAFAAQVVSAGIINPTNQDREIEVEAMYLLDETTTTDNDFDAAVGFTPYNNGVDAAVTVGDPNKPVASSQASQNSFIGASSIGGLGVADASSDANDLYSTSANAGSLMLVEFSLLTDVNFTLSGEVYASDPNTAFAFFTLLDSVSTPILDFTTTSGSTPLGSVGFLPAGDYMIEAVASAAGENGAKGLGRFDFLLEFTEVPEPASIGLLLVGAVFFARRRP